MEGLVVSRRRFLVLTFHFLRTWPARRVLAQFSALTGVRVSDPCLDINPFFCSNLTLLELFSIVVAVKVWADRLRNKRVCFWTNNLSVTWLSFSSPPVLSLLRHLVLRCLQCNIWFWSRHIPGVQNSIADALSRFRWQEFRKLLLVAALQGHPCPPPLWDLVLDA